jgi:hypothetical protein
MHRLLWFALTEKRDDVEGFIDGALDWRQFFRPRTV